jgi:hypothetical protein
MIAISGASGEQCPVVSEACHRLPTKAMCSDVVAETESLLEPLQVGAGTSRGADALAHVCRQCLHSDRGDPQRVLATVNSEHALDALERTALLAAVLRGCHVSPMMKSLLPDMWPPGRHLVSARGIRQCDPFGPGSLLWLLMKLPAGMP